MAAASNPSSSARGSVRPNRGRCVSDTSAILTPKAYEVGSRGGSAHRQLVPRAGLRRPNDLPDLSAIRPVVASAHRT